MTTADIADGPAREDHVISAIILPLDEEDGMTVIMMMMIKEREEINK